MDEKINLKDIITLLIFLALIAIPIYFAYTILLPKTNNTDTNDEEIQEEEETEEYTGPHYEEIYENIEGEIAYIAIPTKIEKKNPPTIVVYSHGSNTRVTLDKEEEFMLVLQKYGNLYTENNLIFAASNQHGENWGNTISIQDTYNMINWIKEKYDTKDKIYMFGYSMGGLPTMNFTTTYPEIVSKIALLAPTTRSNEWNSTRVEKIKDIDIKIWHGTADVNVPYSLSTSFVNKLNSLGKDITLETLDGKNHWNVEIEYMENILQYLLSK